VGPVSRPALTVSDLPSGGAGESGMGDCHGRHSLGTFRRRKAVLDEPQG
jgi:aldehyde dehydrogenase (NAD+)